VRDGEARLKRLLTKRHAEDDRQVCMERARILAAAESKYGELPRTQRQAAVIRDLCEQITPVIEPEDLIVGRMPESVPTPDEERLIAERPELFAEPGLPGCLDSMGIYVPDWDWLIGAGLGGIATEFAASAAAAQDTEKNTDAHGEFLCAAAEALESVSSLIHRYADHARDEMSRCGPAARRAELHAVAERCDRVAWDPPASFIDALQLIQIVHMVLSCLIGGRDVTPGRLDQTLHPLYAGDLSGGRLTADDAVVLLAMVFLRFSQMAGSGTDFDDNVRRTPCKYTHLYVTVGGTGPDGRSAINELSHAILDAARLLNYREPTLVVRYSIDMDRAFAVKVAELVREHVPVTIYNDAVVVQALRQQGVPLQAARGSAHSACHNVIVTGCEAGSGPGGFHNVPRLILLAMNGGRDPDTGTQCGATTAPAHALTTFEELWQTLRSQIRFYLGNVRLSWEKRWLERYADTCPLLQSALFRHSLERRAPCWRSAPVSHFNHCLMGLATAVDSLIAIRHLVFEQRVLDLEQFNALLRDDWSGHEALRRRVRAQLPRFGQDGAGTRDLAASLGLLWVEEVETGARGMGRARMWPSFYSHLVHVHTGCATPATPDGRKRGEPLSENVSPSFGTPGCSPTSILRAMSALPFNHTPSGAASLALAQGDLRGDAGLQRIVDLIEGYFHLGGLHLQLNILDAGVLEKAMATPEHYGDLVVRVTGFSAYFTRLSETVQQDLVRRYSRDAGGDRTDNVGSPGRE